jgi:predicted DnaQ family exonuclease/DinG family helicase
MPRLFDLLSDTAKKELIAETKNKKRKQDHRADKVHMISKPPPLIPVPDFVALDVETTGLDFKNDRIIEIGAIKFKNGKAAEEYSSFVNPVTTIPAGITDLTGITDADVAGAPLFTDIAGILLEFIGTLPLCGHQIEFDTSFLKEELKRIEKPATENQLIDTALLSRVLLHYRERFSLKNVCNVLKIPLDNAHRALHDARASGEIAVKLIPKISELPFSVRQTIAACAPSSLFKHFVFQSLGGQKGFVIMEYPHEKPLPRLSCGDEFKPVDRNVVEAVFSAGSALASALDGYLPRIAQQRMARGVADALNTQSLYIAEAGTGTGKSLAYLVPSALWAIANDCRVIIATRTRNLQDQLMDKDLPVVNMIAGNKLKSTVLKGRSNYLCQYRFRELLAGKTGNLSPRERFAILPLIVWAEVTSTGDIEEQNQFNPKWFTKIWNIISAEHHECTHRRCPNFTSCFFQKARSRALGSHIVIINHALFFSDICSETSFIGLGGPIVFDEAHHLEAGGHRFLRVELDTNRMNLFSENINNCLQRTGDLKEEKQIYECGRELRASLKVVRKSSAEFSLALNGWAKKSFPDAPEYQTAYKGDLFAPMPEATAFLSAITDLYERLLLLKQTIKSHADAQKYESLALETQACVEQAAQLKADYVYLTSAITEEHVFWAEGNYNKGWTKLCGVPLDVGSLLARIWERCNGAVVFTSATLSISGSFDYFKRGCGIDKHEQRTAAECFKSPFLAHQAIGCVVTPAPEVDSPAFPQYVAQTIASIHASFNKNMLVLFTANSMLSAVHQALREMPSISKANLLAQGTSGSRQIIIDEFKKNSGMILLGTDSFWEGIDVPGEACEMVLIPRLPFPVPTHPLTAAIAQRMQEKNGESFFSYAIPEAVIRFRQGAGRLIRTATDRGALIVLDNRLVTRGYGKQFTRSIDTVFQSFGKVDAMISALDAYFRAGPEEYAGIAEERYVPLEEV